MRISESLLKKVLMSGRRLLRFVSLLKLTPCSTACLLAYCCIRVGYKKDVGMNSSQATCLRRKPYRLKALWYTFYFAETLTFPPWRCCLKTVENEEETEFVEMKQLLSRLGVDQGMQGTRIHPTFEAVKGRSALTAGRCVPTSPSSSIFFVPCFLLASRRTQFHIKRQLA